LINVSFWFWYVFPLCTILFLSAFLATVDIIQGFVDKQKILYMLNDWKEGVSDKVRSAPNRLLVA
jgi:hypothetical protein